MPLHIFMTRCHNKHSDAIIHVTSFHIFLCYFNLLDRHILVSSLLSNRNGVTGNEQSRNGDCKIGEAKTVLVWREAAASCPLAVGPTSQQQQLQQAVRWRPPTTSQVSYKRCTLTGSPLAVPKLLRACVRNLQRANYGLPWRIILGLAISVNSARVFFFLKKSEKVSMWRIYFRSNEMGFACLYPS
jgi:hypothetical protein